MKQMRDVRKEIVLLIHGVCRKLTGHANENEVALMLGTAAAESSLRDRVQIGGGTALGYWQMEPATAASLWEHYLGRPRKHKLFLSVVRIMVDIPEWEGDYFPMPEFVIKTEFRYGDDFAATLARVLYLSFAEPIPDDLEGQARYWKKYYNTPAGAGTVEHYLSQWEACRCAELMSCDG